MANKITVIGLGAGDLEQMTIGTYKKLKQADHLYIRTKDHPVIKSLEEEGIVFQTFDDIYEKHDEFLNVYQEIVDILVKKAENHDLVYAVPGHPLVAEKTIQLLLEEAEKGNVSVEVAGGQSFLDPIFNTLKIDPIEGFQLVDATDFDHQLLQLRQHMIICQVYDRFIASEIKLSLMEVLPDEYEVVIITGAGSSKESIQKVPLFELDRSVELDNLTSVYVPPVTDERLLYHEFTSLRKVIATLRGPNGCPWDRKQTHQSLKKYLVEETYEVLDAIDEQDDDHLVEELGDVLLQVMLHSQIGEDEGFFSVDDVIYSITEKMVRRHPHVFADIEVENSDEVIQNWEEIKKQEKNKDEDDPSILDGIPKQLPSLYRAYELQKKAAKVGFDWEEVKPMWEKVTEELQEFKDEVQGNNHEKLTQEFGDILFALVNIARYYKVDPEEALRSTNRKFYKRFQFIEKIVKEKGYDMESMTLEELDEIWNLSKQQEKE